MNRTSFLSLILGGALLMSAANSVSASTVSVRVTNINIDKPGNIMAMLFSEDGFPKKHDKALSIQTQTADKSEMTFTFKTVPGLVAVKILHDENKDGKTSKNWTGIVPSEGLGFSNGAKLSWTGPPKFRDAKVEISQVRSELVIPIIYP